MKSIEQLAEEFEQNETQRKKTNRSNALRLGQYRGSKARNKTRDIERAFKNKLDNN